MDNTSITTILQFLDNPVYYPLLLHCNKGKHRTGCVVGALRKTEGMIFSDLIAEYQVYAGFKARVQDETFLAHYHPAPVDWLADEYVQEVTDTALGFDSSATPGSSLSDGDSLETSGITTPAHSPPDALEVLDLDTIGCDSVEEAEMSAMSQFFRFE
jgi:hypothetical protein